ncbi:hypothetical protein [Lactobacillus hominis]|uniref:hypothetical protein n=1 Tax=Lactobacillus hominis TaxID=1203033 RepID=UPI0023F4EB60|nr:hypothetical protein [Lactobacillus hominis]
MNSEPYILKFSNKTNFWLLRAEGGKYFSDFLNNDYIGIRYNKLTINDIENLQQQEVVTLEDIKQLMFKQYIKDNKATINSLSTSAKTQLTIHAKQTYLFAYEIKIGDFILLPAKHSYEFALGMVVGDPYDENFEKIEELRRDYKNHDISYRPSNYVKRRSVQWISIIDRRDLPKELAWIMNAHQAVAVLKINNKTKLFDLVSPVYKYEDKFYLRVHTSKQSGFSVSDWAKLVSIFPKKSVNDIDMKANINSPGFITLVTSSMNNLSAFAKVMFGSSIGGISFFVIGKTLKLLLGEENLKKKGVIESIQDIWSKHKQNKVKNFKADLEYKELKAKDRRGEELGLSIRREGKPIEKNKSKIISLDIKKPKN